MPTQIEQATQEWAYDQAKRNWQKGRDVWVEVSESFYEQALGVLPPLYVVGGFMVSEPETETADGVIYAGFTNEGGKFYHRYATRKQLPKMIRDLRDIL